MQLKPRIKAHTEAGFTLLELSIVVFISILLTVAIVKFIEGYQEQIKHEETKRSVANAETAIGKFYELAGRYPCPADRSLVQGDSGYGKEDCTTPNFVNGARDIDGNGTTANERVMVGVLPTYATVTPETGIPYEVTLAELIEDNEVVNPNITDAWGNIPLYAVTEVLTKKYDQASPATIAATFDTYKGAIAIVDENDRDTGGTKQDAHFVVISMGADGMGSKNLASGRNENCSDTGYTLQKSNCDLADAKFISGLRSTASNKNSYYDDYVAFTSTVPMTLWSKNGTNGVSTVTTGKVGIGTATPKEKLEIGNSVAGASDSTLMVERSTFSGQLCDITDPTKCITPESLVGLACPAGQYMKRVYMAGGLLKGECVALNLTNNYTCTNGYVRGMDTEGNVMCIDKLPIKLEAKWITIPNISAGNLGDMESRCDTSAGWHTTGITDNLDDPMHSISEEKETRDPNYPNDPLKRGPIQQLCMRTTDAEVRLTSSWTTGSCPTGTIDTSIRDQSGSDKHDLTENQDSGANSNMKWCLGVSGKGVTLAKRWETSTKRYPDCASDEITVLNARNSAKNLNANVLTGSYETLCAKIVMPQE